MEGQGAFFLMPLESIPIIQKELEPHLGPEKTREIMFRYGYKCGENVVRSLHPERVGLKELWTLKWHRDYDTSGPWTKAGGVQPEDWPEWMRGFRDY